MTLFTMCINIIAKPEVIEMYKNHFSLIPLNVKNALLEILCKRGCIKDPQVLQQLINSKVSVMDLSECYVTDSILASLYVCKYLKKLDLSLRRRQTRNISEEVLNSLFTYLPHLKVLAIPHCKEVNDKVINTMTENCTQLEELYIPKSSITDLSLNYIGKKQQHLTVLNISDTLVSDTGIEYLTSGSLSDKLTEINIDKCPNITSLSSVIIAQKCTNIKIFTCGYCDNNEEHALAINGIRSKAKQVFWSI